MGVIAVSAAFKHKPIALFIKRRARAERKVQRTETKQAIEILVIYFVAGEIFTSPVFEVFK